MVIPLSLYRTIVRKVRKWPIDAITKDHIKNESKLRIRRKQLKTLKKINDLIPSPNEKFDTKHVESILARYYLNEKYEGYHLIQKFLTTKVTTWPTESMSIRFSGAKDSLEKKSLSLKRIKEIELPETKREIKPLCSFFSIEEMECKSSAETDFLKRLTERETRVEAQVRDKENLNEMLHQVLKLYHFICKHKLLHTRSLQTAIAVIPLTPMGDEVAECRRKNIISKKIKYVRNILMTYPPIKKIDSDYLGSIVKDGQHIPSTDPKTASKYRRAYKKFLRKCYSIDEEASAQPNEFAYIQPERGEDILFEKIEL